MKASFLLLSLTRGFQKKGKALVPTAFGTAMIDGIHESLTKPDLTAVMEYNLSAIAEGKMGLGVFLEETQKMVLENIAFAEGSSRYVASTAGGGKDDQEVPHEEWTEQRVPSSSLEWPSRDGQRRSQCPVCRRKTLARKYSPKTKKHLDNPLSFGQLQASLVGSRLLADFWVCEEKSCVHPTTGKTVFYADSRKKPVVKLCPQCGVPLCQVYSKKTKQQYWVCPKCNEFKKML